MAKEKIKKVVAKDYIVTAKIEERFVEPDYYAIYNCPHCGRKYTEEIFDEHSIEAITCLCKKKFKVKISIP